jgi:hypothetical protein
MYLLKISGVCIELFVIKYDVDAVMLPSIKTKHPFARHQETGDANDHQHISTSIMFLDIIHRLVFI